MDIQVRNWDYNGRRYEMELEFEFEPGDDFTPSYAEFIIDVGHDVETGEAMSDALRQEITMKCWDRLVSLCQAAWTATNEISA